MSRKVKINLANPRGFCAGVDRAIDIVDRAIDFFKEPIYVKHEVVHNKTVVNNLKSKGAIFIEEISDVPDDSIVIFSAHGVSKSIEDDVKKRNLKYFDATCPLVTKVHMEVMRHGRADKDVILIGHAGHPEVEGTLGRYFSKKGTIYLVENIQDAENIHVQQTSNIAFVTQTTLSLDETAQIIDTLKSRFPEISGPKNDDICYATQNRQDAVKQLALENEIIVVVGSKNSSNSNRLKELAESCGTKAYLIDEFKDLDLNEFSSMRSIGLTAGASAPESKVQEIAFKLKNELDADIEENSGIEETISFKLPPELRAI
ncbi:4-hydroxy-3-methylbut-2-enyl diphosphate reductase [Pseudomonadota bacterium]|nr:4-hydroxy-3-methylbut-2-enyl diphosphate reductase [Pseudomonadota bacterium]